MLKDLAAALKKAREEQETLAKMKKENDARLKSLEEEIIMEMVNLGQKSAAFEGIARIGLIVKLEGKISDKETFFRYLHESDQAHLIKQDVNYMTLQGWLNEISGDELVRAHQSGLDYHEKATIRFTKA